MGNLYIGQVREHSVSFMNISEVIKTEVAAALEAIEQAIQRGQTKEEITEEWNEVFTCEESHFNNYDEIIEYLHDVGI
jgi:hypothetical protein